MKFQNLDTKKFEYFCSRIAAGIGILLMGFLSLYSLLFTAEFEANRSEQILEVVDSPVVTLALMAIVTALLFYAAKVLLKNEKTRKRNVRLLLGFTCIYAVVYGIVWAYLCKYHFMWDAQMISFFADQLANGIDDISAHDIDYITSYPHQLGLIAFVEQIYRLFGWENYRAFQAINAFAAGGIVFLGYQITKEISGREETGVCFLLLMLGCHPLYIYVAFFYGEILSILFTFLSVYALLRYLRMQRKWDLILMAVSITAACLIRSNCYIVLAALAIVLVVKTIADKKAWYLLALAACVLMFLVSHTALVKVYESRLGVELDKAMPSILWVAMGLHEGEEKEAGWYNGLAWDVFVDEAGRDQELATEIAKEDIAVSIAYFKENPDYAADFFKRKIVSQWNEPTYACQVETNHRKEDRSAFMDRIYKGDLWKPFTNVMDVYQSLIYCGVLLFLLLIIRKKIPVEHLCLLIVILGGFIFYVFWEAKSRYIFPYFMMMIPMAACGYDLLIQKICGWCRKNQERLEEKRNKLRNLHTEKLETAAVKMVLLVAGIPAAFLFLYSLFFTTIYENNDLEIPVETRDPFVLLLIFLALSILVFFFVGKGILKNEANRKQNLNLLLGAVLIHCFLFCTGWSLLAQSALRADPLYVHAIAAGFVLNDFSPSAMDYLYTYPHQAGQALLVELVYRLFGYENLFAFRMLNTVGVLIFVYSGYQITSLSFERDEIKVNYLLLAAGCVPLFIYTNVIYGEVLAAAAVTFACWMLLIWLKQKRVWQMLLMILALVFAVYMKNNCLIAAVAVGLVLLVKAAAEKQWRMAIRVIPMMIVLLVAQPAMSRLYEYRSGWPLNQGMPKSLWVAMGLQSDGEAPGWWNEFPIKVYKEQAGYDPEVADAIAKEAISLSLQDFTEHPAEAVRFFGRKFVSQWNDASFGCQVSAGSQDTPGLEAWMNGYHSLVLLGVVCFVFWGFRRRKKLEECLPLILLCGGFLFHMAWEVKGRYGLFYFVLLLPVAAAGIQELSEMTGIRLRRKENHERESTKV